MVKQASQTEVYLTHDRCPLGTCKDAASVGFTCSCGAHTSQNTDVQHLVGHDGNKQYKLQYLESRLYALR